MYRVYNTCIALASPALGNSADNSQLWVTNSQLHHAQCYGSCTCCSPALRTMLRVANAMILWTWPMHQHRYCCSTGLGNSADHLQLWTSCTMLSIYTGLMAQVFIVCAVTKLWETLQIIPRFVLTNFRLHHA